MLTVKQGQNVKITVQVRDINGYLTDGLDPLVSIYPYGKKPGLPGVTTADAEILQADPGAPVKLGQYDYTYTTSSTSQVGIWHAYWEVNVGTLGVPVPFVSSIPFEVTSASGTTTGPSEDDGFPTLLVNNQYVIELRGIKEIGAAIDSVGIDDESWFTSRYTPMYATFDQVISSVGSIVGDIDEDTVNYLIYRYSKYADNLTFNMPASTRTENWLRHTKNEYVIINASIDLIENISLTLGAPKSKQLGDLKVEWADNTQALKIKIDDMKKRSKDLHQVLHSNGNLNEGASLSAGMAIRGYLGSDYPAFGRSIDNMPRFAPSVNIKSRLPGGYRYYPDYAYQNRYAYRYIYRNINNNWPDYGS
jgi:hypothetical protein